MNRDQELPEIGIIVGRFQVPYLHTEHLSLIESVLARHSRVMLFLGVTQWSVTKNNPLDFQARMAMLKDAFPQIEIHHIEDVPGDDAAWSRNLDDQVRQLASPTQTVLLYGGRGSFIGAYSGSLATCELQPDGDGYADVSGTTLRREASREIRSTVDFRWGVCWAAANQHPRCITTVDIAVFNEAGTRILLARKPSEKGWRLIGGFAEPESLSFEADAIREVKEEAGISISHPEYMFSSVVDDPRYSGEPDSIKTLVFRATHASGDPRADDDIAEVRWFDWEQFTQVGWQDRDPLLQIVPQHRPLMKELGRHQLPALSLPPTHA